MISELDIFVGNIIFIDEDVYCFWFDGYLVIDVVVLWVCLGILEQMGVMVVVLQSDIMDYYCIFYMFEWLLYVLFKLLYQFIFQILFFWQVLFIERYYVFDEVFVWEVLGKKLFKGIKKDLDDISIKIGIIFKSCWRQFDNFK